MAEANKETLIPDKLWIFNQVKRGKIGRIWHCKVYISRENRPMRSLRTEDKQAAAKIAYDVFAEVLNQSNTTGTTSPRNLERLSRRYIDIYELKNKNGEKGGSLPNLNRIRNVIGKLFLAFCDFKQYKKPKDLPSNLSSLYIEWRREEGWKSTGIDKKGNHVNGANTKKVIPSEDTIFNELQSIRKFGDYLIENKLLSERVKIPTRTSFVPAKDDDESKNPPFTPSDYRKITAGFRRWIKKDDGYDRRTKAVIYQFFLISTSVGWRYASEGLLMKWSGIKGFRQENHMIKGEEVTSTISKIKIRDSKRNKIRNGEFVNGQHIQDLKEMYEEWSQEDPNLKPKPDQYMFLDPKTGNPLSKAQVYDTFKEKILPDCNLDRNDYTYYSTRKYMITTRIAEGADPTVLCLITGHDERVMFKHYVRINEEQAAGKATVMTYSDRSKDSKWSPLWEAAGTANTNA